MIEKERVKRIIILILIFICIAAAVYVLTKSTYKNQFIEKDEINNNCIDYYEKCVCIGIKSETVYNCNDTSCLGPTVYSCEGLKYCFKINETICG